MTESRIETPRRARRSRIQSASTETLASDAHGLVDLARTTDDAPSARGRRSEGPGTPPEKRGIATG